MVVKDIKGIEEAYFGNHNHMVIPDLVCTYYENKLFAMACYLSEAHQGEFQQCEFYHMMSLMDLGYYEKAVKLYKVHQGDWLQICRQLGVYWKHVALFMLYFRDLDITEYYRETLDDLYEMDLVQLVYYLLDHGEADMEKLPIFQKVSERYPAVSYVWAKSTREKKKSVLSFEDVQWKLWDKENQKIANGDKLGLEHVFSGFGMDVYSYKPKQVAASMHILKDGDTAIILDCGCEISGEDVKRIPVKEILYELQLSHVGAVFVSHAHMDHYGSLNELRGCKVFMTKETKQLIRCVSPETYLGNAAAVEMYGTAEIDGIEVRFVPNGHIRGSVMLDINWKGRCRVVYTGDFSVEDQATVRGFRAESLLEASKKRIDLLITETTYGKKKGMYRQKDYEAMFLALCEKHIQYGNKVLIPCFAVGRAQEVALLLSEAAGKYGWRILIDGLASKVTDFYQSLLEPSKKILNKNITVCHSELDYKERVENYDVILASSGMLKPGSVSARYVSQVIDREKVCVMKVGFIQESEHLLQVIQKRRERNLHFVDLSLSAHAGYGELIQVIDGLSPDHVVYVHGGGIEVSET